MKQILLLCVAVLVILATGTRKIGAEPSEADWVAKTVAYQIVYFKDTRTGLCFAFYWGGHTHGGPSLASVPCEKVPPYLLAVFPKDEPPQKK